MLRTLQRRSGVAASLLVLMAGAALLVSAHLSGPRTPTVLDRQRASYLEDEHTGRVLAGLDANLRRVSSGYALELRISAQSPFVDPEPGYRGIRGGNRRTALELERLVKEHRISIETRQATAEPHVGVNHRESHKDGKHRENRRSRVAGRYREGRRGHLLERRWEPGKGLQLEARSNRAYLLEIFAESGVVGDGRYSTYVVVDRVPRLRIDFEVRAGRGRIREIRSLGAHTVDPVRE